MSWARRLPASGTLLIAACSTDCEADALRLHSFAVRSLVFFLSLAAMACAHSAAPPARSSADDSVSASAAPRSSATSSSRAGSSDGVTCEQARAQYTEEI